MSLVKNGLISNICWDEIVLNLSLKTFLVCCRSGNGAFSSFVRCYSVSVVSMGTNLTLTRILWVFFFFPNMQLFHNERAWFYYESSFIPQLWYSATCVFLHPAIKPTGLWKKWGWGTTFKNFISDTLKKNHRDLFAHVSSLKDT